MGEGRIAVGAAIERERAADQVDSPRRSRLVRWEPGDKLFWFASVLLGAWALFQNFFKIGTAPILADEPVYAAAGRRYLHGEAGSPPRFTAQLELPDNFEHPPLTKYLFGLAQTLVGAPEDLTAARCVSATATVLAALVAGVWIGRIAGRWTGLLAAGLLAALPQPAGGSDGRFGRFAMLDPLAMLFMVVSVVLAWEWSRRGGRSAWLFALWTGGAVALAAGAKENGWLGAVGPVALILAGAVRSRPGSLIRARIAQVVVAAVVAVAGFAALYLPISNPVRAIRYLFDFQSTHSSNGHLVGFAGRVTDRPPWWANLWFAGHAYGSVLTCFIVIAALCAVALRRDALVGWCSASLAAPFGFHCFVAHVALGFYWVLWTPMVLVLAALGACEVIRAVTARLRRFHRPVAASVAMAVLVIPVVESVGGSVVTARIRPAGVQVLPAVMARQGLSGPIVSTGVGEWAYSYYLPSVRMSPRFDASAPADTIVIAKPQCRDPLDPAVRALVAANEAFGAVRQVYSDAAITVYAAVGTLSAPTASQVAHQPVSKATDDC